MDKRGAAELLINKLQDEDASYESIVFDGEDGPIAAVIVCQGEPATEVVLEAVEEVVKSWEGVKG